MATLVLTSTGAAVAGPVGATAGAFVGRAIDDFLQGRSSSGNLSDFRLQTSHYGSAIPATYGRMRVAGCLIWASDLVETAVVSKATSARSYSVSFAVALTSRRLLKVGRIWADGRLIRGMAGDPKIPYELRVHSGDEDQPPDPLIAAFEGLSSTPAYRGLGLAVFEDFDLSTFGNRIPQLTFEIECDEAAVSQANILEDLFHLPRSESVDDPALVGFLVDSEDYRSALQSLLLASPQPCQYNGTSWSVGHQENALSDVDERAISENVLSDKIRGTQKPDLSSSRITLHYYDEQRDYGTAEMSARSQAGSAARTSSVQFPGVMTSEQAKSLAHRLLAVESQLAWKLRAVCVPFSHAALPIGAKVKLGKWADNTHRISAKRLVGANVELLLSEITSAGSQLAASPGRIQSQLDEIEEELIVELIELPREVSPQGAPMALALAGGVRPWRAPPVVLSSSGRDQDVKAASRPSCLGVTCTPLLSGPSEIFDELNAFEVTIPSDENLHAVTSEALLAGANLAMVGEELLQFGEAERLGRQTYRLRNLLRGRFGSVVPEQHALGTRFVVIEQSSLSAIQIPDDALGLALSATAYSTAGTATKANTSLTGRFLKPLSPVSPKYVLTERALELSWFRRDRTPCSWLDEIDAPLGERVERYAVCLEGASGLTLERLVSSPHCAFERSEMEPLGQSPWRASICQLGQRGRSPACLLTIS